MSGYAPERFFSSDMISACAGRPFLAKSACCLPDQMVSPALETVTVMG